MELKFEYMELQLNEQNQEIVCIQWPFDALHSEMNAQHHSIVVMNDRIGCMNQLLLLINAGIKEKQQRSFVMKALMDELHLN